MIATLGIIQVQRHSRGAHSKIGRKLGGKSLLEWVVRRVTDCQRLEGVVVAPADREQGERIRPLVPPDVPIFERVRPDALAQFVAAMDAYGASAIVRVYADNPFIDPVLIDRLVSTADAHPSCDYIGYCSADGRPAILSHLGVFAEWCSADALRRAHREATSAADREHVTPYLYAHAELFEVRLIPLPLELEREDLRLRIDSEEDWEHAQAVVDSLGHEEWDWRRLADLMHKRPAHGKRAAHLDRVRSKS